MNLTDKEILELTALANAVVDETLTDAQRARLSEWLGGSEEARRFYVRYVGMSASLFTYASEMQSEAPDALPAKVIRPSAWWWATGSLAAAACVVLGLWVGVFSQRDKAGEKLLADQEREETVARISGTKDCRWKGGAWQPGDDLRRGQQLELASGFAEITFDSGAQVTLEGPASFDLNSAWDAVLRRGTLKASVPTEAIGFRIANAAVEVVDLGTEFSMVADKSGATEVFVLKGAVEAAMRDASGREHEAITLNEKQARRFAKSGVSEVADKEKKFARFNKKVSLDRMVRPANYVHWSFDEVSGAIVGAQVLGMASGSFDARLNGPADTALTTARTDGRWGRALKFDGQLSAKAPLPGISRRTAHTVSFWVKLPDAPVAEAGTMVSWSLAGGPERVLDISVGGTTSPGVPGALRTRIGRKFVVGATSLRDGKWHHVAVVVSPAPKSEAAFQLKQYVDGKLEAVSKKMGGNRWPSAAPGTTGNGDAAGEFVWLGQRAGSSELAKERFHGDLDELFIADRALTPPEIRHLMKLNKPAQSDVQVAEIFGIDAAEKGVAAR